MVFMCCKWVVVSQNYNAFYVLLLCEFLTTQDLTRLLNQQRQHVKRVVLTLFSCSESNEWAMQWVSWKGGLCKPKLQGGMSFRNMSAFNKALLAKQVWRLIHNPNSLLARVLKSKYFRDKDIMDAELGHNPSFVWRSLMWSRELIQKKLCWRVGDGNSISIKRDAWIPRLPGYRSRLSNISSEIPKVAFLCQYWGVGCVKSETNLSCC